MPLDRHNLIFMLQRLNNLYRVKVRRVRNVQLVIVASTCQEVPIHRVRNASHLLLMDLLMGETLAHVEIPD
jgi:hypothetical protein